MNKAATRLKTHCEQYGHIWEPSMVAGWDRCTHTDRNGRQCSAARRRAARPLHVPALARTPEGVTVQAGLWEVGAC